MCRIVAEPKGSATIFQDRRGLTAKAASNLLMKAECCEMRRCLDEAGAENIADATTQYEVVIPFALEQHRIGEAFGQLGPAEIDAEKRSERVQLA